MLNPINAEVVGGASSSPEPYEGLASSAFVLLEP